MRNFICFSNEKCSDYLELQQMTSSLLPTDSFEEAKKKNRVFFLYAMRRVQCSVCGVRSEFVPWSNGKHQLTIFYMKYLADWCRHLSWKEVASQFHTSWHKVFVSVRWVVEWGLKQRSLEGVTAIGVDEIQWKKGHKYLTLVYQINQGCVRLLWISLERTEVSFNEFFNRLDEKSKEIKFWMR